MHDLVEASPRDARQRRTAVAAAGVPARRRLRDAAARGVPRQDAPRRLAEAAGEIAAEPVSLIPARRAAPGARPAGARRARRVAAQGPQAGMFVEGVSDASLE